MPDVDTVTLWSFLRRMHESLPDIDDSPRNFVGKKVSEYLAALGAGAGPHLTDTIKARTITAYDIERATQSAQEWG